MMKSLSPAERLRHAGKENGFWNAGYDFAHFCRQLFRDFDFRGKNVLEIGCGRGLPALWAGAHGAARVVGLEPLGDGADGTRRCYADFATIAASLGMQQSEILATTFQEYDGDSNFFDLILSVASINHLDEESCVNLRERPQCLDSYRGIFLKMYSMMKPGGTLIIVDAARHNMFGDLGIHNPIVPMIEWNKHQDPEVWADLLEECGFGGRQISWLGGRLLRYLQIDEIPRLLSYALESTFRLQMVCERGS